MGVLTILPPSKPKEDRDNSSILQTLWDLIKDIGENRIDCITMVIVQKDGSISFVTEPTVDVNSVSIYGGIGLLQQWYVEQYILGE